MISFFLTVRRLFWAFIHKWREPDFRNIAILMIGLIATGTIFYTTVEGWYWFDSVYFCVVTLATVGYGDLTPHTTLGKAFTICYIFIGLGLFVAIAHDVADGLLKDMRERQENRAKRE